ncbi:180_t:CDS:2, partial [Entrophospora sp. SA101]
SSEIYASSSSTNLKTPVLDVEFHPHLSDTYCVVCLVEPRVCVLKPCGCFSICETCREMMAQRNT